MLILASASPRRQELLRSAHIDFAVQPTNVLEVTEPGESPDQCAERLAYEKALAIATLRPDALVLGADTIVVVENEMLAKPEDEKDAERMLRLLSGRSHQVITGVCLMGRSRTNQRFEDVRSEATTVTMQPLSDEEIHFYARSGEPMDKAGGYAIQGIASRWISRIEGDYSNVVGLPVSLVYRMLREHEVQ
jgi:nucleoside triphosphate pyrophosphatase